MTAKKSDQPSAIDALAEDAVADEYPEGAPLLIPYLQIRPRSKRAQFKRQYAEFAELQERMQAVQSSGVLADKDADNQSQTAERLRVWAELDDYMQAMDDLMAMAAVNPDAYREWSDQADDAHLTAVFQVYARRTQPGEASSSAT